MIEALFYIAGGLALLLTAAGLVRVAGREQARDVLLGRPEPCAHVVHGQRDRVRLHQRSVDHWG